ncbi:MAG: hypothetical protein HXX08_07375 [Chloroflexi bacterium]|uniref:Uncharacterized protein n=1 Tax=Candidatus Chlorohelix allophototropha TaxID=3003348 RepID=A0A8T7LUI9_9CHLR|nr:hypothetical protein [Chloroflexota bacterium]WJW67553.1 hypothetical protein OZ401_000820 [Chloroflexota bacterium L227-S17]
MSELTNSPIDDALARLEAWLETMRCPGGYGGPVAHWWQQSLLYTGPGLDWRYEGIILGYLLLWKNTGQAQWLEKACRAGNDLLEGQLKSKNFKASSFERNPAIAGTPHEAACDIGLLSLALALGEIDQPKYAICAEQNIKEFLIEKLWDEQSRSFCDNIAKNTFVPNKAATICEALFLLAEVTGESRWVDYYALPTLNRILQYQCGKEQGRLEGAVAQNSIDNQMVLKYFPLYNARCVTALLKGYRWSGQARFLDSAIKIMRFITSWSFGEGSFPTVVYSNGTTNTAPNWIAALGDILRANAELATFGADFKMDGSLQRLLNGQDDTGGIQTASGFARQAGRNRLNLPDVRDVLHVAGWCDKAFRFLAGYVSKAPLPEATSGTFEVACVLKGQALKVVETPEFLEVKNRQSQIRYRWQKGKMWATVAEAEFWLK